MKVFLIVLVMIWCCAVAQEPSCHVHSVRYCTASFLINPESVPRWVNELTGPPPVYIPTLRDDGFPHYEVEMRSIWQQMLPGGFPRTPLFAYGGEAKVCGPFFPPFVAGGDAVCWHA